MSTQARQARSLMNALNKKFGTKDRDAVRIASEIPPISRSHSGSLSLDFAIGGGGVPEAYCVEIAGQPGTGKTTTALLMARQFLDNQPERMVLILDMEHKLSPDWTAILVGEKNIERVLVMNPDTIEQATDMYRHAVSTGQVSMVILDSIGGAPSAQVMDEERSAEKSEGIGGNAKGVTKFARFAANFSVKYDCLTVGINQVREDTKSMHGNMLVTPGGRAWAHACILRIEMRRGREKYHAEVAGEKVQVGWDVIARIHKNQAGGVEGRTAQWRFFAIETDQYGPIGVDVTEECMRLAIMVGVVQRAGAYYRHAALPDGQVQGQAGLLKHLQEDEALRTTIISELMASVDDPEAQAKIAPVVEGELPDSVWKGDDK